MLLTWLTTENGNGEPNRKLDVVDRLNSWHDIGLFALNQVFYFQNCLWAVKQNLCQTEVVGESIDVVGHDNVKSALRAVDFSDLEYLHVVPQHFSGHLERRNVNHFDLGVFKAENSAQLRIFSLQEFLHRDSLELVNRDRADMDFNSFLAADKRPFLLELVHHFSPNVEGLICKLLNTVFSLLLEQEESEPSLDNNGFLHQESQVLVRFSCLVHSKVLLNADGSTDRSFWPLKHPSRHFDEPSDFFLVYDAVEHLFFGGLGEVFLSEVGQLASVYVSQVNIVLAEQLFKVHQDEAYLAPTLDVGSTEAHELRRLVDQLALSEQQLVKRILVHELVIPTTVGVLVLLKLVLTAHQRQLLVVLRRR